MANKPAVTLTLAGDEKQLTQAFDRVGAASKQMADQVDDASRDVRSAGARFDDLAESTDTAESRFTGFYDTLGGTRDAISALNDPSLSLGDRLIALGQAGADLAGGFTEFVIPALKGLWTTLVETVIPAVWSFTTALLANPITWVVIGIIALIAIIVLLITHWDQVKQVVTTVINWIRDRWNDLMGWFAGVPGWFGRIFGAIGDAIGGAFKSAINWVIDRLNWFVDRANDLIYGINLVNPFSDIPPIPHIPHLHTGISRVPGPPGSEQMAILQAGERVTAAASAGGGGAVTVAFAGDTDGAFASAFQMLVRTGAIQVGVS